MIFKPLSTIFKAEWRVWLPVAALAFVGASLLMSGWPAGLVPQLSTPFSYSGDGMAYLWNIQRAIEGAWYFENNRSGFPFGSNHLDYPTADTGTYLTIKLIGLFFSTSIATLNIYYLLGFPLCVVSAYLVSRSVNVSRHFSVVCAVLYAFSSFHFGRLGHLFFTWYFVAPLFFYIGFKLISNQLLFINDSISKTRKTLNLFFILALSSFGIYYALFGFFVVSICAVIAWLTYKSRPVFKDSFITLFLIALGVLLNVLPSLIYIFQHGENHEGVHRLASESELYGLKITQLLLPRGDHRLDAFFELASKYNLSFPLVTENVSASLGLLGSMGFLVLLGVTFIYPFLTMQAHPSVASNKIFSVHFQLKVLAAVSLSLVLFATVGGFSSLFALLVSSSIRSWNRISIFIGFCSILGLVLAIEEVIGRCNKYSTSNLSFNFKFKFKFKLFGGFLATCLLVFGLWDQTAKSCHACQLRNSKLIQNDQKFVRAVEGSLPDQSAIYQLPYMRYSDNGALNNLGSYDQARGHLNSQQLKWSFGGVRGRTGDWFYRQLAWLPIEQQIRVVSAMGFAGIYIDRRGFLNQSDLTESAGCKPFLKSERAMLKHNCITSKALEESISKQHERVAHSQQIQSDDGHLVFIPLKATLATASDLDTVNAYLKSISFKLVNGVPVQIDGGFEQAIDLRVDDPDLPAYVGKVAGLDGVSINEGQREGRWTDALLAKHPTVWLAKPLPKQFSLSITARAAGLNTEKPMKIKIGGVTQYVQFGVALETKTLHFDIAEPAQKIEFIPADPFSPARRWGDGARNLIAILFQKIQVTPSTLSH